MAAEAGAPHATRAVFEDVSLTITNLGRAHGLDDLRSATGYLMISVKNRSFSNRLIDSFCRFAAERLSEGVLIVVDGPYVHNVLASKLREQEQRKELETLRRISDENHRRVERILARHEGARLSLRAWSDAEEATPEWLVREVASAFARRGRFYRDVLDRTREVIPNVQGTEGLERFSQFMIREVPVLCGLYYLGGAGRVVDCYPGENPALMWNIERGVYADELPGISRIASGSEGLIYVDFRGRRDGG